LKILGIVGWPGSGKTTLLVALLPLLRASGLSVSTIKYADHGFDIDKPGKDSHRHRLAGAHEVLVSSSRRWALLHENGEASATLPDLAARLEPVDLILVEGVISHRVPRLEVFRFVLGKPPLWDRVPEVVGVASDSITDIGPRVLLPLNRPEIIAAWIRTLVVTEVRPGS
jgi:molybdopterin-guanine dinucleotide biosynthesis protein B